MHTAFSTVARYPTALHDYMPHAFDNYYITCVDKLVVFISNSPYIAVSSVILIQPWH